MPLVSIIVAMNTPSSSAAARARSMRRAWSSNFPCDRFSRTTLVPARIIARRVASSSQAGPMVATILVLRSTRRDGMGGFLCIGFRPRAGAPAAPWVRGPRPAGGADS